MGLERYLLHDFFTALELNDLERRGRLERRARVSQRQRADRLEAEVGRAALLLRSLAELCIAKGVITAEELRRQMLAVDLVDGVADQRLDPRLVAPGSRPAVEKGAATKAPSRRRPR